MNQENPKCSLAGLAKHVLFPLKPGYTKTTYGIEGYFSHLKCEV